MPVRPLGDVRAIAATAVGLLLVSLVALASGGSPWHAGGRQDVPVGVVRALAVAAGALVVGSLLLAWMGTPPVEKRRRRRRRLGARDLEGLGASLSAAGKAAAIIGGAIGLFLLLTLPFLVPGAEHGGMRGSAPPRGDPSAPLRGDPSTTTAPAREPPAAALTWLVVGSAAALLLVAPAAVAVRRRRARRARQEVVPDAAARVGSGLRRSLADLEFERDPRRAVQRAYARMEESLGAIELSRARDETPTEFTARVLRVLGASAAAASDVTGLFEIARFSDHPMDEDDRRRAIASVRRVEAEVAPR
ncbi:MAG TPA: DUF4129 domain-containing protein [Gaiellaceae bacterium]|nr:DUF4129 domain-containing protein [Gaiellaceae bacterium]